MHICFFLVYAFRSSDLYGICIHHTANSYHWLTHPKGIYQFRYFLPQCVYQILLLPAHACIHFCVHAWADNNRIWYMHWGRKYLNWYTPFGCVSQCYGQFGLIKMHQSLSMLINHNQFWSNINWHPITLDQLRLIWLTQNVYGAQKIEMHAWGRSQ